jgi:hypothetical protein
MLNEVIEDAARPVNRDSGVGLHHMPSIETHQLIKEATRYIETYRRPDGGLSSMGGDLLCRLGCPSIVFTAVDEIGVDQNNRMHSEEDMAAIRISLPMILCATGGAMKNSDREFLLAGLNRHDCWRTCLETEDGARALALALVGFVVDYWLTPVDDAVAQDVLDIFNGWLKPSPPWEGYPSDPAFVCQNLFGEVWTMLALNDNVKNPGLADPEDIVRAQCPPLLPGLYRGTVALQDEHLPELGLAS